jgi:hypothetical protein
MQTARVGATCQKLNLSSMKLMTGTARLAEVAFSAVAGGVLANEAASYALTGEFGVVAETAFAPEVWTAILRFRLTAAGTNLRAFVREQLEANQGAEIVASIDAGSRQAVPSRLLAEARGSMSALLMVRNRQIGVTPGILCDLYKLWDGPAAWMKRSKQGFEKFLRQNQLGPYDPCPCGSNEPVKFCCRATLDSA